MAHMIAVAGKGGVGKTTFCGLLIQYLIESGKAPVLAVDADSNANLNEVLGVEVEMTFGALREELSLNPTDAAYKIPEGMNRAEYLEMRLMDAMVETDNFDLMVMGRSQGKGCYCYINSIVQRQIDKLKANYPYIVVDNEAGMEHLSRGILPEIDTAILVSDCSRRGVQAAGRIAELMREVEIKTGTINLIVNKAPNGILDAGTMAEVEKQGLNLIGVMPRDEGVYQYDCDGIPTVQLPKDSPVRKALAEIVEKLGL